MIYVHANSKPHAEEMARHQGWRDTDWEVFTLQGIRGLSQRIIVTCECVPMDIAWIEYLKSAKAIIVTVVCPRCAASQAEHRCM